MGIVLCCSRASHFQVQLPLGIQVPIRTNLLEFEFTLNSHEFVDPSEFELALSNSNSLRISLNRPDRVNP